MAVYMTKWQCPEGHTTIGLGWDDEVTKPAETEAMGEATFASGAINRWCGLCGARDLTVVHEKQPYATVLEAGEAFYREQAKVLLEYAGRPRY